MTSNLKQPIATTSAPAGRGPFPQALRVGPLLFLSGQGPLHPVSNQPVTGGFSDQVEQCFANVEAILAASGLGLEHVVKVTVYLSDISRVPEFNALYIKKMSQPYPARTLVQAGLRGIDVELDVIAADSAIASWGRASP